MTKDELREYAEALIVEHARDIEFLSIFEMAEEHAPGGDITDDEAREVDNGDGTHSLRDTVENRWIERDGQEDMLPHQARSLKVEYDLS